MKLIKNLVVRVKCMEKRPSQWNNMGMMDEYVNKLVVIEDPGYIQCTPLFEAVNGRAWSFDTDDFVKANTIHKTPDWVSSIKYDPDTEIEYYNYTDDDDGISSSSSSISDSGRY